ncbi:MAG: cobalt ECF transporter T component CbiQ [bacterium]
MEHRYLDEYAYLESPIHRLEARTKIICTLALIVSAVLIPPEFNWPFAAHFAILAGMVALSKLPPLFVLKRAMVVGPFILTAVILVPFSRRGDGAVVGAIPLWGVELHLYRAGLLAAKGILFKSFISASSVILLVSTTHFSQLLKGMERLRFPRLIVVIISFLYRYLFLLLDEFMRVTRAAGARNWEAGRWRTRVKAIGGIVGSLFLRTYSRAERVHIAMLSRGFDGDVRTLYDTSMAARDFVFIGAFLAAVGGIHASAILMR